MMDEEIRQALTEVREMKQMCGNINMKLTNIVTQRGQDWKKKLEAEYQRGLDDAWEAARKVGHCKLWDDYTKDTGKPSVCAVAVLDHYTAYEAIAKLKAYEEKQKEDEDVKRGDVVRHKINGLTYIVTLANECGYALLDSDGNFAASCITNSFEKTGKHVDIDKILEGLRYDN